MLPCNCETVLGARHLALELAMHGVVLEHISHVLPLDKGIIDSHHLDIRAVKGGAQDQATDTTEACER